MAKLASVGSPAGSAGPLPWISVLILRPLPAFCAGILTAGDLPKIPDTATDAFALAAGDDDPHPDRATAAVSGTRSAAAMRRMYFLVAWGREREPAYPLSALQGPGRPGQYGVGRSGSGR